ncbi:hypothetical protein L596_022019 [Steinernema carpocapsae]|uniref:Uncharacterized protein n=1 Tax=Steinernema carpocapsae TaxID=34508 RepID=A0A4U5MKU9_STECR|nr:hypothetical protein L596_022019 [Steinernema carpocapsae]
MNVHARSRSHCSLLETKTPKRRIRWMGFVRSEFIGYRSHDNSDNCDVSDMFKTAIGRAFSSFVDARAREQHACSVFTNRNRTFG